ncbi:MAG TPA: NUDIX hydrolase [Actinomycetaceae bacterium]|nr:NUDIX hydrolase [Actinomycetaceae bacterium]
MSAIKDYRDERRVVSREEVWRGRIVGIISDQVDLGNGTPILREWVDHPGAVGILAMDDDECVALIRQYRHAARATLWEIPAGLLDVDGEDHLTGAKRELAEETDLAAEEWHVLADIFCTPGGSNESLRVYLARGISYVEHSYVREDEEAEMELRWVPLDDAIAGVLAGDIHSPSATLGILSAAASRAGGWASLRPPDAPWLR